LNEEGDSLDDKHDARGEGKGQDVESHRYLSRHSGRVLSFSLAALPLGIVHHGGYNYLERRDGGA
jgi:hypothetical protein